MEFPHLTSVLEVYRLDPVHITTALGVLVCLTHFPRAVSHSSLSVNVSFASVFLFSDFNIEPLIEHFLKFLNSNDFFQMSYVCLNFIFYSSDNSEHYFNYFSIPVIF